MKRIAIFDKQTAQRAKKLGDIGEDLTKHLLKQNGFESIRNLNRLQNNFPFGDFYAEKNGVRYVISVKIRNRYEFTRDGSKRLNSRYKLGSKCYAHATAAERQLNAVAAWLTISLDAQTYCAYFGLLSSLSGSRGVNMSAKAIASYECLAKDVPHNFSYSELQNVYETTD